MKVIFKTKTNYYNILNVLILSKRNVKTVRYGLQTMPYAGSKIWDFVPKDMKQVTTLNESRPKSKFEVRKLSLPTLQNLNSTDWLHYIMSFNKD